MSPTHPRNFGFRISDLPSPSLNTPPGHHSRRGAVAEGLVARAARHGHMVRACACQVAVYRGPQQRPGAAAPGAAKPPRRPRGWRDRTAPRGIGVKRRFRDRDEIGPLAAFLRLERGGTDLVIVPTERREENAARGPESARSHKGRGVRPRSNRPPARRRRAALEVDGSDESLLSEETSTENAWPWAQPADGGHGNGHGSGVEASGGGR